MPRIIYKDSPILIGFLSHNGTCRVIDVWCPYCHRMHRHGWPDNHTGKIMHRWCHCDHHSPDNEAVFWDKGYFITDYLTAKKKFKDGRKFWTDKYESWLYEKEYRNNDHRSEK